MTRLQTSLLSVIIIVIITIPSFYAFLFENGRLLITKHMHNYIIQRIYIYSVSFLCRWLLYSELAFGRLIFLGEFHSFQEENFLNEIQQIKG